MNPHDDEGQRLRSVALQNAQSILAARQRVEQELLRAKEALEQRSAELAQSLAMMSATLEATTDGILVTDNAGRVTGFNHRYIHMWMIPAPLMEGRDHRKLLTHACQRFLEPRAFLDRVESIYATSQNESFDVLEMADGTVFDRASRIQFVDGRNVGRVWSFRDVTAERRSEDERKRLLESERRARAEVERASDLKDEFLATLSHELRTPLSAILGWSMLLRRPGIDKDELHRGLDTIERNTRVQTQLIEDLLDMSRITSGKVRLDIQPVEPVLFIEAAIDTLRPAAEAKGIRIEKVLDPVAGPIAGDPNRLQQVIWNLLSNAIKFTPRDGRVQIVLDRVNSQIEISVTDTGIGIETEFLPYVFDRFRQGDASTTRSHGGLGLGLAIARNLIELHGGTIQVASPGKGRGTSFVIKMPLQAVHRSPEDTERQHPRTSQFDAEGFKPADLSGIRILVVDDESDARDLIRRVLEDCEASVLTAATANEAVALVEHERPHVLVSDIGMPDVDGYELLRRVRALGQERGGRLPAVALTAFARSEDRTRALRAGFLVHVAKPVEPSELVATVASVVGRTEEPVTP